MKHVVRLFVFKFKNRQRIEYVIGMLILLAFFALANYLADRLLTKNEFGERNFGAIDYFVFGLCYICVVVTVVRCALWLVGRIFGPLSEGSDSAK